MEKMENDRLDAMLRSSARVLAEDNAEILVGTWREIPPKTDRHIRRTIRQSRRMREYGALYRRGRQIAAVFCVVCAASSCWHSAYRRTGRAVVRACPLV